MEQPRTILKSGTKIRTHDKLERTGGMIIKQYHLDRHILVRILRRPDIVGTICGVVGGGGDVYWVQHPTGVAAYCWD